jgi:pilus assembly protein CpaB
MRSKMMIIISLVMGVITTYLFYQYMQQFDHEAATSENTREVVLATRLIKENERISPNDVSIQLLPQEGVHPQAVVNLSEIEGKFATSDIEKGELILNHRLQSNEEERKLISRKVTDGYRAVSIESNFVQSVSNLIEPNDYVDVIFSEEVKTEADVVTKSKLLLKKVRVLAVGRRMIEASSAEDYIEYSSVTLELKPEETIRVIEASERGNLQFTVHSRVIEAQEVLKNGETSQ